MHHGAWEGEITACGSWFLFHRVDAANWLQVLSFCGKHIYQLRHLSGPLEFWILKVTQIILGAEPGFPIPSLFPDCACFSSLPTVSLNVL